MSVDFPIVTKALKDLKALMDLNMFLKNSTGPRESSNQRRLGSVLKENLWTLKLVICTI